MSEHLTSCNASARGGFQCSICNKRFKRGFNLRRHRESMHANELGLNEGTLNIGRMFACGICKMSFQSRARAKQHRADYHERVVSDFREVETAHKRAIRLYRLDYPDASVGDVVSAFRYSHSSLCRELERQRSECGIFRFGLTLHIEFIKVDEENLVSQSIVVPFRSRMIKSLPMSDLDVELSQAYSFIQDSVLGFVEKGSGWIVDEIMYLDLEVAKCLDLTGSCHSSHVVSWSRGSGFVIDRAGFPPHSIVQEQEKETLRKIPRSLKIFGSPNRNKDCFYIALARHFNREMTNRNELLTYAEENFKGIKKSEGPVSLRDIDVFEKANEDLAIHVIYMDEEDRLLPVRTTKRVKAEHQIVLLLAYVKDDTILQVDDAPASEKEGQHLMHYICIEVREIIITTHYNAL